MAITVILKLEYLQTSNPFKLLVVFITIFVIDDSLGNDLSSTSFSI